jgi:hypothetical protein
MSTSQSINTAIQVSSASRMTAIGRLTALWALSESGLGGIMHALKIPFTGLIVGGISVIIVSLISYLSSNSRETILRSLIIVLTIKLAISPHSSFTAYVAVSFQAASAWFFYRFIPDLRIAAYVTAIISMLESALQKVIILTIFYGNALWEAINTFGKWATTQAGLVLPFSSSEILIVAYLTIYIINGIFIGHFISSMFSVYNKMIRESSFKIIIPAKEAEAVLPASDKKSSGLRFLRQGSLWIVAFVCLVLLWFKKDESQLLMYFIIRVILVFTLWYGVLGPVIKSRIKKLVRSGDNKVNSETDHALLLFPYLRQIVTQAWAESKGNIFTKIPDFLKKLIFYVICFEIYDGKDHTA